MGKMVRLRCGRSTAVLDREGRPEAGRRIDAGDICLVGERAENGLYPVVYPTRSGTRSAWLRGKEGLAPGWRIYNQNRYGGVAYPAPGYAGATVRSSGCGVTAMAMVVENLVLGMLDPAACARIALDCGARVSGGTDLRRLGQTLCGRYPMKMTCTSSWAALTDALDREGIAVVNTGGDRAGYTGVFSTGGHYIVLLARQGQQVYIADPGDYAGKYEKSGRRAVQRAGELLCCDGEVVARDSANRNPPYYLFERRNDL